MEVVSQLAAINVFGFNIEPILQLTFVALIMLAGPAVIFLLAARGGDL